MAIPTCATSVRAKFAPTAITCTLFRRYPQSGDFKKISCKRIVGLFSVTSCRAGGGSHTASKCPISGMERKLDTLAYRLRTTRYVASSPIKTERNVSFTFNYVPFGSLLRLSPSLSTSQEKTCSYYSATLTNHT